jgi:putative oxygen-independent coproporphyrinogen III oxidase
MAHDPDPAPPAPPAAPLAPPRALYLHVPFCPQVCPYCDFHKMRRDAGLVAAYVERVVAEAAETAARWPGALDTVYVGGGTPSHLDDDELDAVLAAIARGWGGLGGLETTLEADPLTFDADRLARWRGAGVSRVSIGLQSTQDDVLRFLGRGHRGADALRALDDALAAGLAVSADVITAVPGQDAARDLAVVAASGVGHVSVYTLTVEAQTPFARRGVRVDEDRAADDYDLAEEVLAAYGFERYEVSNHARPGQRSRHNPVYWRGEACLALGPSAAGLLPPASDDPAGSRDPVGTVAVRTQNPPIKAWLRGDPPERTPVDGRAFVLEKLMTGLRTSDGVDLGELRRSTGVDVRGHLPRRARGRHPPRPAGLEDGERCAPPAPARGCSTRCCGGSSRRRGEAVDLATPPTEAPPPHRACAISRTTPPTEDPALTAPAR